MKRRDTHPRLRAGDRQLAKFTRFARAVLEQLHHLAPYKKICEVGMADPLLRLVLQDCAGRTFHNSVCSSMSRDLNNGPNGDKRPMRCEVEGLGECDVGQLFVKCVPAAW
jgi:hypothetical protein